jgi:hypothetical protein
MCSRYASTRANATPTHISCLLGPRLSPSNITLCSDSQCKNEPLSIVSLDGASGCRTDFAGQVLAVKVTLTDANNSDAQKVSRADIRSADGRMYGSKADQIQSYVRIEEQAGGWLYRQDVAQRATIRERERELYSARR